MPPTATESPPPFTPVELWGLPLAPLTLAGALDLIDRWVAERTPRYVITANLHYVRLSAADARLDRVNRGAAMVLADGMPLVWAARGRLPERVAGADLVPAACARAAAKGHRVFLLGAAPGVADSAARRLCERFSGLVIAGTAAPPFRELAPPEQTALLEQIRAARPDLLFVALGQPKGELWAAEHGPALGVPVTAQVGATLDVLAGRARRAPRWLQRAGLEWAYRLGREPGRLAPRYARDAWFLMKKLFSDALAKRR